MKKIFLNISGVVLLFTPMIFSQQFTPDSPEWLVDMFFNQNEFPDKAKYFSGEMLNFIDESTIGEELKGEREISFHQIIAKSDKIIFTVEVSQDSKVINFYCFLIKQDNSWKIFAIRRFILPDFIYTVRDSLSELSSLSSKDSSFYLSLKLFTMTDNDLKDYLKTNLKKFEELVTYFNNKVGNEVEGGLVSVGCNAVYGDTNYPGCTFIQILAWENMESGYIYSSESATLPELSELNFIYIEEVLKGWFIFRKI